MSELPKGWVETRLGEVVDRLQYGYTASASHDSSGPRFLRITDITNAGVKWEQVPGCTISDGDLSKFRLNHGDMVFARSGSIEKACKIENPPDAVFASYLIRGAPLSSDIGNWLDRFVRSQDYLAQIGAAGAGIGMQNVSAAKLAEVRLRIAPLNEQRRIVAKLDAIFERARISRGILENTASKITRLKHALLGAAFRGDLTALWRTQNDGPESARHLVETTRSSINNHSIRRAVPETVPVRSAQIPSQWEVFSAAALLRAGVLLDLKDGNHGANHPKASEYTSEGVPFLAAVNLTGDRIDYDGAAKITGATLAKIHVGHSRARDVILTHKGSVGRVAVATRDSILTPQTTYYRPNEAALSSEYLALLMRSPFFQRQLTAEKSQTTRDFIPVSGQYELSLIVAPRKEQDALVAAVAPELDRLDRLHSLCRNSLESLRTLEQSALARAFRGELVAQDPADEPASALLDRIRAERAAAAPAAKPRRGRPPAPPPLTLIPPEAPKPRAKLVARRPKQ